MKAEIGKTYVLVQEGKAHQIFTASTLPEWHDGLTVLDITNKDVSIGDNYSNGVFTKSPPPTTEQIKQSERNQARADLEGLDRASLREVIEYIASKADAPATLKARNLAALVLVEKIK